MTSFHPELEICINADCLASMSSDVRAAVDGGADRVELCAAMADDGLTPSAEAMARARALMPEQKLLVMVRPRAGNFVYTEQEHAIAIEQISVAKQLAADGVVFGSLTDDHRLHISQLNELICCAKEAGLETTFHRAFDELADASESWSVLGAAGINRVLSCGASLQSGKSALQALPELKSLYQLDTQVELVIGGGINAQNAAQILAELKPFSNPVSLHSHSGVMTDGKVDTAKVRYLSTLCKTF